MTPLPIAEVPWPRFPVVTRKIDDSIRDGTAKNAGIESIWATGPSQGPILRVGSAVDPRVMWHRVQSKAKVPLVVHDLRWAQGNRGRKLARAVQRTIGAGTIGVSECRMLIDVEAARLGVKLVDHAAIIATFGVEVSNEDQAAVDIEFEAWRAETRREFEKEMKAGGHEIFR